MLVDQKLVGKIEAELAERVLLAWRLRKVNAAIRVYRSSGRDISSQRISLNARSLRVAMKQTSSKWVRVACDRRSGVRTPLTQVAQPT
jgi:hypothetical protein